MIISVEHFIHSGYESSKLYNHLSLSILIDQIATPQDDRECLDANNQSC